MPRFVTVKALRLLLVEDQPDLARVLTRILGARGFEVTVLRTRAEAEAFDGRVHCAILDIDLPDGSGIDVARVLSEKGKAMSTVFFSAQTDPDVVAEAESVGPFVSKSLDIDVLISTVGTSIRRALDVAAGGSGAYETDSVGRTKAKAR